MNIRQYIDKIRVAPSSNSLKFNAYVHGLVDGGVHVGEEHGVRVEEDVVHAEQDDVHAEEDGDVPDDEGDDARCCYPS